MAQINPALLSRMRILFVEKGFNKKWPLNENVPLYGDEEHGVMHIYTDEKQRRKLALRFGKKEHGMSVFLDDEIMSLYPEDKKPVPPWLR